MSDERFRPRPRDPHTADLNRWPAVRDGLLDLLAECSMIVDRGRSEFDEARSLTYRAAEAVVIHFDDLGDAFRTTGSRCSRRISPGSGRVSTRS